MAVSMEDLISTMKSTAHVGQGSDLRELQVRSLLNLQRDQVG